MVKEIISDIFTAPIRGLTHVANCQCNFGSGIAREVKKRFPEAYQEDLKTIKGDKEKLGTFSFVKINGGEIFNIYGQFEYGRDKRNGNYEAIYTGLEGVRDYLEEYYDKYTLGIPFKIGSDRAGCDWAVIKQMIYSIFKNSLIDVLICIHPDYLPPGYKLNQFLEA